MPLPHRQRHRYPHLHGLGRWGHGHSGRHHLGLGLSPLNRYIGNGHQQGLIAAGFIHAHFY